MRVKRRRWRRAKLTKLHRPALPPRGILIGAGNDAGASTSAGVSAGAGAGGSVGFGERRRHPATIAIATPSIGD